MYTCSRLLVRVGRVLSITQQPHLLASQALISEVGEPVSISSITNPGTNWRGRAQQVLALQQKVADLQDKLKEVNGEEILTVNNSAICAMRQIEKDRQITQEQIAHDFKEKTQQLEEVKRKLEASRARCKVLEADLDRKKRTIEHYTSMDTNDKELIQTMSEELDRLEKKQAEREKKETRQTKEWEEKYATVHEMFLRERSKNDHLELMLSERDERIQKSTSQTDIQRSERRMKESVECPTLASSSAAEAERLRLLELVTVLNRRLDDQRTNAMSTEDNLRRERARCARLETKVGRLEMEKHGLSRGNSYASSKSSSTSEKPTIPEGVRYKMEFMEEELLALKARLDCVKQEKEEDLRIFRLAMDDVQRAFSEGGKGGHLSRGRSSFGSPR